MQNQHHRQEEQQANGNATSNDDTTIKTHYDALGVPPTASYKDIKASFHHLARLKHPDKQQRQQEEEPTQGDDKEESSSSKQHKTDFERIQLAWKCLGNEESRAAYDQELYAQQSRAADKRAIPLTIDEDFQAAVDDETGETAYVYDCRCGQELQVFQEDWGTDTTISTKEEEPIIFIECSGCCFVYRVSRR